MLNILYAGSPDVSVIPLRKLLEASASGAPFRIAGVLTNPPAVRGRGHTLVPTPVAEAVAEAAGSYSLDIPVLSPEKLDGTAREAVTRLNPDVLVCFAYGKIFGPKFMSLFPLGGINLHPSLLPRYRGCAPVPAAILDMQPETGVSIQKIAQEMDSGNILAQTVIPLDGTETAGGLLECAAGIGGDLLVRLLAEASVDGTFSDGMPQNGENATYSRMLRKEDGCICWNRSAREIDAQIRAFTPWPGAFTCVDGTQLKILTASVYAGSLPENCERDSPKPGTVLGVDKRAGILIQTGDGILCVAQLQWQAKKAVDWKSFINGSRNFIGVCCTKSE